MSLDYAMFIGYNGDCLDRYILRYNELTESCRMIYAILYGMLGANEFVGYCVLRGASASTSITANSYGITLHLFIGVLLGLHGQYIFCLVLL